MDKPRLSVVLPLADDRGLAASSLRAWTRQTLPAVLYEVVVADDGHERRATERARKALRPSDVLVARAGANEIELYQAGAEAARGDFLLFTELHAVPAANAALELLRHLEVTGAAAASLRSAHIARPGLAGLEKRLGEAVRADRPRARWWAGVSLRGLALRRSLFHELGGFRTELERFAETALAIEMDRRGLRAEEVEDAVVHHGDCAWPGELERALLALGRGRRAYIDAGPPALVEPYVGAPGQRNRAVIDRDLARALCGVLARSVLGRGRGPADRGTDLASFVRWWPTALGGASGACLVPRTRARLSFLWGLMPRGDARRRLARFRRAWSRVETCGEIQHLAGQSLPPPTMPLRPFHFTAGEAKDTDFLGFYSREEDAQGSFRWTAPAALWRLALSPCDYRARLRVFLPPAPPRLRLYLNGSALVAATDGTPDALTFDVPGAALHRSGEQHLVLLSAPYRPGQFGSTDGRTLGIGVRSLDLVPAHV